MRRFGLGFGSLAAAILLTVTQGWAAEIDWSTYLGGSEADSAGAVAVDASGNLYVAGRTASSDFPVLDGLGTTLSGGGDAFVAKVDPSGELVWSSYLGGSSGDSARGVAVDENGSVYLVGYTSSSDFPTAGGFDMTYQEGAFVAKIDASGQSLIWSSYLGGTSGDTAYAVALDGDGNVFVVGYTTSTDFPTDNGFDTTFNSPPEFSYHDAFVTKVHASGQSLVWSSYLGGFNCDHARDVAVDGDGNVYVVGDTESGDFPVDGGFDTTFGFVNEAFVTKVNSSGESLAWSSYLGGEDDDAAAAIAVDGSGNAYVVGFTRSTDFPGASVDDPSRWYGIPFVSRVDAAGALEWSFLFGDPDLSSSRGVAVDPDGSVYVAGQTYSTDFQGYYDTFVVEVEPSGQNVIWQSHLGGALADHVEGIAVDQTGNAYVAGYTTSTDFPFVDGLDDTLGGWKDAFLARFVSCGDGDCDSTEDCEICPADCGPCPEPAPDLGVAPPDSGDDMGLGPRAAGRGCLCGMGETPGSPWDTVLLLITAALWVRRSPGRGSALSRCRSSRRR
jgi:hypothetical protein